MILRNIQKSYNKENVVGPLNLTLTEGEVTCILGKSGSGKTTLLHLISGLLKADSGKVEPFPGKKSFLFQDDSLLPWYDAITNLTVLGIAPEKAQEYLDKVALTGAEKKYPRELSGGMRRRVAIARALAYGGHCFFLDEPCRGLDIKTKTQILDLLALELRNKTAVIITHDPEEAFALHEKIILTTGPPLTIVGHYEKGEIKSSEALALKIHELQQSS